MKKLLLIMTLVPLLASGVEYEFLTPRVAVLKGDGAMAPANHSTVGQNILS